MSSFSELDLRIACASSTATKVLPVPGGPTIFAMQWLAACSKAACWAGSTAAPAAARLACSVGMMCSAPSYSGADGSRTSPVRPRISRSSARKGSVTIVWSRVSTGS
eukprot:scaffold14790_cov29-Tisochrysis_lutea.AAC.5